MPPRPPSPTRTDPLCLVRSLTSAAPRVVGHLGSHLNVLLAAALLVWISCTWIKHGLMIMLGKNHPGAPSGGADIHLPPRRPAPTPNSSRTSYDLLVAPPLRHYPGFACLFMWCFHGRTLDVIAMSCDKDTTRGFGPLVPWHLKVDFQAINGLKKPLKERLPVLS